MPNRNVEGNYRYKYQGQEKDPETGKEAFELRLWDSRIGRWLTTDPGVQFFNPYLGMGNNPIGGIEVDGADWWQLTKEGSLVLIKETKDRFNIFFDSEGVEISRTNGPPMAYLKDIEGLTGDNHEFIYTRMAQRNLIGLAIYNNNDIYIKMKERAKEAHWKSTKVLDEMRDSGDLASKQASKGVLDAFMSIVVTAVTKKPSVHLTTFERLDMAYSFKELYGAVYNRSNMIDFQNRMGNELYEAQRDFIKSYPTEWFFIFQNIPSTNNLRSGNCGCKK